MEEITAKITGLIFSNRQTGFCVLRVVPEGKTETIVVRGSFPGIMIQVGLKAKFVGRYEDDPKFGRRLNAQVCELMPESGRAGIITYLSANVPSIGPITAARLYDMFGDELIEVLNSNPEQIRTAAFLQARQADAIIQEWAMASENRTTAIFLSDLGLNTHQIKSVIATMGVGQPVRDKIMEDPYQLCSCFGIGFATADTTARKLKIGIDDPRRVCAFILYAMNEMSVSDGHMFCTSQQLLDYISNRIFRRNPIEAFSHGEYMSESHFYSARKELLEAGKIVADDTRLYLSRNWEHESVSAESFANIVAQPPYPFKDLQGVLDNFESTNKLQLSDEQKQAFLMLQESRTCVVSGYPGTGKTLLISAFVHLFEKANMHYVLMSPTGIAAKRLSQVTGKMASTIHRALGYGRDGEWEFNHSNKFIVDAVIVDEMSMVDSATFYHLITALSPNTIVILVGDVAQLPSVGAGYVLNNLMNCDDVPHVALTRIYRQEKKSDIISTAHSILRGDPVDTTFNKDSEFVFLEYPGQDRVLSELCDMASRLKANNLNFQVIAPKYDGDLGVDNLNLKLREVLNPEFASKKAAFIKHGEVNFYEGDRIMVIKNDYDRMIFNGDVGKIQRISVKHDEIEVKIFDWFDQEAAVPTYTDKVFMYKVEEARQNLRVAYACTAHKVQGQEFDFVLMPMTMQYGIMLYKNLVYTAITRAKKKVFIFGDPDAFAYSVSNNRETVRNSALKEKVRTCVEELRRPSPAIPTASETCVALA